MRVKIYFTRHGFSKSNELQKHGNAFDQVKRLFYLDPPLTKRGTADLRAVAKSPHLVKPDILLSSIMLRAMQTGLNLFPHFRGKLYPVPYLKEVGMTWGNQPMSPPEQRQKLGRLASRVDYRFVSEDGEYWDRGVKQIDFHKFLLWLEDHLPVLLKLNHLSSHRKTVKVVIIGHSTFMRDWFMARHPDGSWVDAKRPFNAGMLELQFDYRSDGQLYAVCPTQVKTFHPAYEWRPRKGCAGLVFRGIPVPPPPTRKN